MPTFVSWSRLARFFVSALMVVSCPILMYAGQVRESRAPLFFEPNEGQAPSPTRFVLRDGVAEACLESDGLDLVLPKSEGRVIDLKIGFEKSNPHALLTGLDQLPGRSNYLLGNDSSRWLHGLPNYARVRYQGIYPGIDILFYGKGSALEHDFEIAPGADPGRIALRLRGAKGLEVSASGDLQIHLPSGIVSLKRPIAYQEIAGTRKNVEVGFLLSQDGAVRFRLGAFDPRQKLVIDPVLVYATYVDSQPALPFVVASDSAGNTYVTGITFDANFPVTSGALQTKCPGCADYTIIFVTKFDPTGESQVYSTFLGGSGSSESTGIAVDSAGNAVVAGNTGSMDFPVKNPVVTPPPSSGPFISSLTPDGSSLNYSSVLATGYVTGVAIDSAGNAYISGYTSPVGFVVTPGALNATSSCSANYAFVSKFSTNGSIVYSALPGCTEPQTGGAGFTGAQSIAVDANGNAYITGGAGTAWTTTPGAYLTALPASAFSGIFVAKLNATGSALVYSTYIGQGDGYSIALDSNDDAWIAGVAYDDYPLTPNAYDTNGNSGSGGAPGGAVFSEISPDGSQLLYSSYFGDPAQVSPTVVNAIAIDKSNNVWLVGTTQDYGFPLRNPLIALQSPPPINSLGGVGSGFVSELDSSGTKLEFSTLIGGWSPALSAPGVAGMSLDPPARLTSRASPLWACRRLQVHSSPPRNLRHRTATWYGYTAVIDPTVAAPAICTNISDNQGLLPDPSASLQITNCGNASLTFQSITTSESAFSVNSGTCTGTLAVGGNCSLTVAYTPSAGQSCEAVLAVVSNASIPTLIPLSQQGAGCRIQAQLSSYRRPA